MNRLLNRAYSLIDSYEGHFTKPMRLIGTMATYTLIHSDAEVLKLWTIMRKRVSPELNIKDFDFVLDLQGVSRKDIVEFIETQNFLYNHDETIAKKGRMVFSDRENEHKLVEVFLSPVQLSGEFDLSNHINVIKYALCPSDLVLLRLQTNLKGAYPNSWDKAFADLVAFFIKYDVGLTLSTDIVTSRIVSLCGNLSILKHVENNLEKFRVDVHKIFENNNQVLSWIIPKVKTIQEQIRKIVTGFNFLKRYKYTYWTSKVYQIYLSNVESETDHADKMVFRKNPGESTPPNVPTGID